MNTVRDLLTFRSHGPIHSVSPCDTVAYALRKMSEENLGAILVMDYGKIVGLFSERDYARKLLLEKKSSLVTPIQDVMTKTVLYVTPEYLLDECLALMTKKHIHHLPVLENGEVSALLSLENVVEAILDGKEFMISELTRYVTGSLMSSYNERKPHTVRELPELPELILVSSAIDLCKL